MFDDNTDNILQKLGGFGVQKFVFNYIEDTRPLPLLLPKYYKGLVQNVWYANQRLVVECLGCDFFMI